MGSTTLHLLKQNFKFSSGHFLIFDDRNAEKLHGHNYRVQVDIGVPPDFDLNKSGYFVDFTDLKKIIKIELDKWDEHVLLPADHQDMKIAQQGENFEIRFRERFYSFPQNEVILLPVTNTSVEQLSKILAQELFRKFKKFKIQKIRVRVEETPGQSASTIITDL